MRQEKKEGKDIYIYVYINMSVSMERSRYAFKCRTSLNPSVCVAVRPRTRKRRRARGRKRRRRARCLRARRPRCPTPPTNPRLWRAACRADRVAPWALQDNCLLRGCCVRIDHSFTPPAHLHCPPWCNTIARLLGSIRLSHRSPVCLLYTIHY